MIWNVVVSRGHPYLSRCISPIHRRLCGLGRGEYRAVGLEDAARAGTITWPDGWRVEGVVDFSGPWSPSGWRAQVEAHLRRLGIRPGDRLLWFDEDEAPTPPLEVAVQDWATSARPAPAVACLYRPGMRTDNGELAWHGLPYPLEPHCKAIIWREGTSYGHLEYQGAGYPSGVDVARTTILGRIIHHRLVGRSTDEVLAEMAGRRQMLSPYVEVGGGRTVARQDVVVRVLHLTEAATYLEIGVDRGETLLSIPAWIRAEGVDVDPSSAATSVCDSQAFLSARCDQWDVVFVDGDHREEAALADLVEAGSRARWLVVDDVFPEREEYTLPLEVSGQQYSGRVWAAFQRYIGRAAAVPWRWIQIDGRGVAVVRTDYHRVAVDSDGVLGWADYVAFRTAHPPVDVGELSEWIVDSSQ